MRIAIITHEIDDFDYGGYFLNRLCDEWEKDGATILPVRGVEHALPQADVAILHMDITCVEDAYLPVIAHYPRVINGHVLDISKTAFSNLLLTRDDAWSGPVIVKTNANYGGLRELEARIQEGDLVGMDKVQRPWRRLDWMEEYEVFGSIGAVPSGVWRNPALVVEKFLPERNAEGEYVLKMWFFLGEAELYLQIFSNDPIIKGPNMIRREKLDPATVPDSIRWVRERMNFEFGKFDFGIVNGEAALYDVNRTPAGTPRGVVPTPDAQSNIEHLAAGLRSFL